MMQCWARSIGGCSGKISGEHIVSEGLWAGDEIVIKGLPWCKKTPRVIRKESFTANILCTTHNSELSPVDDAGIRAFRECRTISQVYDQRGLLLQAGHWSGNFDLILYELDGSKLERWFLKTLINMELAGSQRLPIGPQCEAVQPPRECVEIAFGRTQFEEAAGLYFLGALGQSVDIDEESVLYTSWVRELTYGSYVAAGEFRFHGLDFFLCLEPSGMPKAVEIGDRELGLIHRPSIYNFEIDMRQSQRINFRW